MKHRRARNYIDGAAAKADCRELLDVENPSTGDILAQVPLSTVQELDRDVATANAAFPSWDSTPVSDRCEALLQLVQLIRDNSVFVARIISEAMSTSSDDRAEVASGTQPVGKAILDSPGVDGISFRVSSRVGRNVAQACPRTGKRFQAFGPAKNHMVVMLDAKANATTSNMLTSSCRGAGQKSVAASPIACVREEVYAQAVLDFVKAAREVMLGSPLAPELAENSLLVGPVISKAGPNRKILARIVGTIWLDVCQI